MTVVVKIGGARAVDHGGVLGDIADLRASGTPVVIVHGGSTAVDETLERLGIEPEYVETPDGVVGRFTDEETMEAFTMAMAGTVNTTLVTELASQSVEAVGLSGVDGRLLSGPRKSAVRVLENGRRKIRRGDHSGTIKSVNTELIEGLVTDGYVPVIGPPMAGLEDDGSVTAVNTDADRAAAAVAGALGGELILLTDVTGVYSDPDDPESLIEDVANPEDFERLQAAADGFMKRKVMAASEAIEDGAENVVIADANNDRPVQDAMAGSGTHISPEAV